MKEISEELDTMQAVICVTCGAIFEGAESISKPCPECGAGEEDSSEGLYWIESGHSWIVGLKANDDD